MMGRRSRYKSMSMNDPRGPVMVEIRAGGFALKQASSSPIQPRSCRGSWSMGGGALHDAFVKSISRYREFVVDEEDDDDYDPEDDDWEWGLGTRIIPK